MTLVRRRGRRDDRGAGVVELPVMASFVFVPLVCLVIFVGRLHAGHMAVESAARHAARTISLARDPAAAVSVAEAEARATTRVGSPLCRSLELTPTVTPDRVTVTVSCAVDVSEATRLPVPGTRTVTASATEIRDRHREAIP